MRGPWTERVVFAPDVLVVALALPGSTAARALERTVGGTVELMMSRTVLRATLARLVGLFDHDVEAVARTALWLHDAGTDVDLGPAAPGLPTVAETTEHLALLCAACAVDALVATAATPHFGPLRGAPRGMLRVSGAHWRERGRATATGGAPPVLYDTEVVDAREFARRAVVHG